MLAARIFVSVWIVWTVILDLAHQARTGWVWFPGWIVIFGATGSALLTLYVIWHPREMNRRARPTVDERPD